MKRTAAIAPILLILPVLLSQCARKPDPQELFSAVTQADFEMVQTLLRKGVAVNAQGKNNYTALHHAAEEGFVAIAELLLTQGANINAKTKMGDTPLHKAAWNGHAETVALLLARGADPNAVNGRDETPLHCAASKGYGDIVGGLIDSGAKVNAKAPAGTPLDMAEKSGHTPAMELLRKHGAKLSKDIAEEGTKETK